MKRQRKRKPSLPFPKSRIKNSLGGILLALALAFTAWVSGSSHTDKIPHEGTPVEFYANQTRDDLTHAFVSAIEQARESVTLLIYSLTDPSIISCLKRKCNEGVRVHVVCDAKASPRIDAKLGDDVLLVRRFGPGLMHQKILVIDDETTWLGSANMTTESLRLHGNLVNAFHSKSFASAVNAKANTLEVEGKAEPLAAQHFVIGGQPIELWFLPDNTKASIRLKELIRQAKKTVQIAMFTWTRQDLARTVIDAANRGIKTEVVIDRNQGKGSGAAIVKLLKDNNIDVRLSDGNALLHHKFLYIDSELLVNGSANWTKAAFTQNDDCFIVVHDLTEEQKGQMDELWSTIKRGSSPVD